MPTITSLVAEGAFTRDTKDALNANFAAVNSQISTASPANSSAVGTAGTIVYDAGFIYVCVATNSWRRVATVTF
jgi:hypothetical protein